MMALLYGSVDGIEALSPLLLGLGQKSVLCHKAMKGCRVLRYPRLKSPSIDGVQTMEGQVKHMSQQVTGGQ